MSKFYCNVCNEDVVLQNGKCPKCKTNWAKVINESVDGESNKPMSPEEMDEMAYAIANAYNSTYDESGMNIYQSTSVILGILGAIASIILAIVSESVSIAIIGIYASFVVSLFMYGFGEIIKKVQSIDSRIKSFHNSMKK